MKILDKTARKCLLVVDVNNKLLGTITDGDIRRSILAGAKFSDNISGSYNTNPTILSADNFKKEIAIKLMRTKRIDLLPIVDQNHIVVDYISWSDIDRVGSPLIKLQKIPVVIMAGGRGTRLEPFTNILPKPLIPVHDKPIIEHIIERFNVVGCSEFYLTINYKGKILKAYFEELKHDYQVHFVEEERPLGTAGSISLFNGQFDKSFFVTNCDIIVKTDYTNLYDFHKKGKYFITIVASAKEYVIPYGTCELNSDGHFSQINEKPKFNFLINTGLYVLHPDVLKIIPKNKHIHFTELIKDAKKLGKEVGVYPIDEDNWIDVGQWAEYQKAVKQF